MYRGRRNYRSFALKSASALDAEGAPAGTGNGSSSRRSPSEGLARPSAIIWVRALLWLSGTSRATGWPWWVISIASPAATRRKTALTLSRSSRTPTLAMATSCGHNLAPGLPEAIAAVHRLEGGAPAQPQLLPSGVETAALELTASTSSACSIGTFPAWPSSFAFTRRNGRIRTSVRRSS
jgi:hypothetical protein